MFERQQYRENRSFVKFERRVGAKFLKKCCSKLTKIHQRLVEAYDVNAHHHSTVPKGSNNFARERHTLEDDPLFRRPAKTATGDTTEKGRPMLKDYRRIRIQEVEVILGLSFRTV